MRYLAVCVMLAIIVATTCVGAFAPSTSAVSAAKPTREIPTTMPWLENAKMWNI